MLSYARSDPTDHFADSHNATVVAASHGQVASNHTLQARQGLSHDQHHRGGHHRRQDAPVKVAKQAASAAPVIPPVVAKVGKSAPSAEVKGGKSAPILALCTPTHLGAVRKIVPLSSSESVRAAVIAPTTTAAVDEVIGAPPLSIPTGGVKIVNDPKAWSMPGANTPAAGNGIVKRQGEAAAATPTSLSPVILAFDSLISERQASLASVASRNASLSAASASALPSASAALADANMPAVLPAGVLTVPSVGVQVVTNPAALPAGFGPKATPSAMIGIVKKRADAKRACPPVSLWSDWISTSRTVAQGKVRVAPASAAASGASSVVASVVAPVKSIVTAPSNPVKVLTAVPTGALKPTPNAMAGIVRRAEAVKGAPA